MAEYNEEELEELCQESAFTAHGDLGMLARLAEAVQLCDAHRNIPLSVRLRSQLITHAMFCGQSPQALVAMGWILAQVDRDPELEQLLIHGGRNDLMWYQKWVVTAAVDLPNISRPQIDGLLADMRRRYAERGFSMATVEYIAMEVRRSMGDLKAMREHYERWQSLPMDRMSDCRACVINETARGFLAEENLDKALEVARPLLRGGMACMTVPTTTYAGFLIPLLKAGRVAEADRFQRKGQRAALLKANDLMDSVGKHLTFLALTDQLPRARKMVTQTLGHALVCPEISSRWTYLLGLWTLLARSLAAEETNISLKVLEPLPIEHQGGRYPIPAVQDWCRGLLEEIGGQFDRRNGNDQYEKRFAEMRELVKGAYPLPE